MLKSMYRTFEFKGSAMHCTLFEISMVFTQIIFLESAINQLPKNYSKYFLQETLSISAKEEILSIANKVIPGFWTNGFIKNPIQNIVYWNEIGENIMPDLWAEGKSFSINKYILFLKPNIACKRFITYLPKDMYRGPVPFLVFNIIIIGLKLDHFLAFLCIYLILNFRSTRWTHWRTSFQNGILRCRTNDRTNWETT